MQQTIPKQIAYRRRRFPQGERLLLFYLQKRKTLWLANHVDTVDKGLDIQMSVHTLGQAHGTGMTGNLLLDGGVHTSISHHGNTGVPGVMRLVLHPVFFH